MVEKSITKEDLIKKIKNILQNLGDGEISTSAYDTAWVAKISSDSDASKPQFPNSLKWLLDNQLTDGSWGAEDYEYIHDRIINTLSTIISLKIWHSDQDCIDRGVEYINRHLKDLTSEKYATVGFELVFPKLIEEAKKLNLKLKYDEDVIIKMQDLRNLKLSKLPMDYVYSQPSTILHSLEGLDSEIDFEKITKFQAKNGSFLNSPSSTAFVYIHTKDKNALKYIEELLSRFGDSVPVNFPIDNFQRLWIIEQLTDLGIENFFEAEINEFKSYLNSNWSVEGLTWSKYVQIADLDDTSAAYKFLRGTNKNITSKVFDKFFNSSKSLFFCYPGELNASLSHILRLFEALNEDKATNKNYRNIAENSIVEILKEKGLGDKWNIAPSYLIEILFQIIQQDISQELLEIISKFASEIPSKYLFETDIFYPLIEFYLENKKINIDYEKIFNLYKKDKIKTIEREWIDKTLYSFADFKREYLTQLFKLTKISEVSKKISDKKFTLNMNDFGVKDFVTENKIIVSDRIVMNAIAHSNFIYTDSEVERKKVFSKYVIFIFLVDDFFDSNNDINLLKQTEGQLVKVFKSEIISGAQSPEQLSLTNLAKDFLESINNVKTLSGNDRKMLSNSLLDTIGSMIKEKDISRSDISFRKYLDISNKSIGVPLAIDILSLLAGNKEEEINNSLKDLVGDIIRLCNDLISFEREKTEVKLNIFKLNFLKNAQQEQILEFVSDYLYTKLLFYYNSFKRSKNSDTFITNVSDMLKFTVDLYTQADYR